MIGRMHHVVLDGPDPGALAAFYSALLGLPVTYRDNDWVVVAASDQASGLAFQRASGHQRPTWPDPAVPQQVHLDIMVEDPAAQVRRCWHWALSGSMARMFTRTQPATRSA
jgi:catechol 2,3-dioxygenase-like lactoylglutathione lyase family enzyme